MAKLGDVQEALNGTELTLTPQKIGPTPKMKFKKAEKTQSKLRLAVYGPSGSGKTFTALRMATGMGGAIGFIDTERGSAQKYADRFNFDVMDLDDKSIVGGYIPAIAVAASQYPILIIDSLSHGWEELLEEVDQLARVKFRGNTWSAWSEGTPKQKQLINTILNYPGHIIVTMRSDTEWSQEKDERGKIKPVKIGLKPRQGKGIEYEFDMLMELNLEHYATVSKDRTGKYQDKIIEKPGEDFGRDLIAWLSAGQAPAKLKTTLFSDEPATDPVITKEEMITIVSMCKDKGIKEPDLMSYLKATHGLESRSQITTSMYTSIVEWIMRTGDSEKKPSNEVPV